MLNNIIESNPFKEIAQKHIYELLNFILEKGIEFSIVVNIEAVKFKPKLPSNIQDNFSKFSLFSLVGYTLQSTTIDKEFLFFEAGFGKENIGSVLQIPLHSIFQIILEDNIIYINLTATVDKFNKDLKNSSLNKFKNNPNNKKFS